MILVLIGLPASGKGTQASLISSKLNFNKISVGDLLREEANHDPKIKELLKAGSLLPGEIVDQMVEKTLNRDKNANYVLDGYPRSMKQTEFLIKNHKDNIRAIHLDISSEFLLERIKTRYMCASCNAVYSESQDSKINKKKCDFCFSTEFVTREDDNESTFRNRIAEYQAKTLEVINYFSEEGILNTINAQDTPEKVFSKIKEYVHSCKKES